MNRKDRRTLAAQERWQRARRAVRESATGDPGRELLMAAVERGYLTPADAESLDAWGERLGRELAEGRLTEDEIEVQIIARVRSDLARRGQA